MTRMLHDLLAEAVQLRFRIVVPRDGFTGSQGEEAAGAVPGFSDSVGVEQARRAGTERDDPRLANRAAEVTEPLETGWPSVSGGRIDRLLDLSRDAASPTCPGRTTSHAG